MIAEDQTDLRVYTRKILEVEGYTVIEASSGTRILEMLKKNYADLLLLDLNLGDMDGSEILKTIRNQGMELPVIIVSSYGQIDRKVNAFDIGCDDYITKPYIKEELLARIKRLCRKSQSRTPAPEFNEILTAGEFEVDFRNSRVLKQGKEIVLNRKLFEIFSFFLRNEGQVISKDQLFERFWWDQADPSENTLNVHIHMLREKIEDKPRKPKYLKTKRGIGFYFSV